MSADDLFDRRRFAARLRAELGKVDDLDAKIIENQLLPAVEGRGTFLSDVELSRLCGCAHTTCMRRRVRLVLRLFPGSDPEGAGSLREG